MNRTIVLFMSAGLVAVSALGLRVRSHHLASHAAHADDYWARRVELTQRGDYVSHPVVAMEELDAGPRRIISIAPSITETLCALGMQDRFVGRTQYCLYPPAVEHVERIGALFDTNFERIMALRPDAMFATANSRQVIAELKRLDLPVLAVPHETLDDVFNAIDLLGYRCGRPRTAATLSRLIREDLAELQRVAARSPGPRLRVVISTGPMPVPARPIFVAGPGSFHDELLRMAGHDNVAAGVCRDPYGEVPIEKLIEIDPDVILEYRDAPTVPQEVYEAWSNVGELRAVRLRRIDIVGGQEWLVAGPRIAVNLRHMIAAVNRTAP